MFIKVRKYYFLTFEFLYRSNTNDDDDQAFIGFFSVRSDKSHLEN